MAESGERGEGDDVAVVFVHGIGAQLRGQTLTEWAEPLARRLALLARSKGGELTVESTQLHRTHAETTLLIRDPAGERRIYMLEARWADAFVVQSDASFVRWSVAFAGRALGRTAAHLWRLGYALGRSTLLGETGRTFVPRMLRALVSIVRAAVLIPYAAILLALTPATYVAAVLGMLVLGVLARLPYVSRWAKPVIVALNTTLGDAAVWTTRPVSAAAIRTMVRDALIRARALADRTVVVAHSQGAAVAADLIFSEEESVQTLITVGGAVLLLRTPRWALTDESPQAPVAAWSRGSTNWINMWATWDPVPSGPVADEPGNVKKRWQEAVVTSAEQALYARDVKEAVWDRDARYMAHRPRLTVRTRTERFLEPIFGGFAPDRKKFVPTFFQGGDFPLPMPVLGNRKDLVAGPAERPVYNKANLFTDHVTYTANIPEVIDPIARAIFGDPVAGEGAHGTDVSEDVRVHRIIVECRFWWRVPALLLAATFGAPLAAAVGGVDWWERLRTLAGTENVTAKILSLVDADTVGVTLISALAGAILYGVIEGLGSLILSYGREELNWPKTLPASRRSLRKSYAAAVAASILSALAMYALFAHWGSYVLSALEAAHVLEGIWLAPIVVLYSIIGGLVMYTPALSPWSSIKPAVLPERRALSFPLPRAPRSRSGQRHGSGARNEA